MWPQLQQEAWSGLTARKEFVRIYSHRVSLLSISLTCTVIFHFSPPICFSYLWLLFLAFGQTKYDMKKSDSFCLSGRPEKCERGEFWLLLLLLQLERFFLDLCCQRLPQNLQKRAPTVPRCRASLHAHTRGHAELELCGSTHQSLRADLLETKAARLTWKVD